MLYQYSFKTPSLLFLGKYVLREYEIGNDNQIEVSNSRPSINDTMLIQCPESSTLQITEINYGNKSPGDVNDKGYCYVPQWYKDKRKCINDVSNTTL